MTGVCEIPAFLMALEAGGMAALEAQFSTHLSELETRGLRRRLPAVSPAGQSPWLADFSHNDYLGLANQASLTQAGFAVAREYGMGATGSRLLSGNSAVHEALEADIAKAKGCDCALIFNSGYQANATALAALLDKKVLGAEPLVFADRLNHASLHHACQLMGVHQQRYRHNDLAHLRDLLLKHQHLPQPKFIIAETVFGMDGDQLDVPALMQLADEFDAFVYLDEAHATGVFGAQGYGLAAGQMRNAQGQHRGMVMGTFSKALGASGAYVACSETVRDYLLNRCGGFIYSTALSPAVIGAVQAAWQSLPGLQAVRSQLLETAQALRDQLQAQGFDAGTSTSHIVPIILGDEARVQALKVHLQEQGILTSAIRPPTVPPNTARLRIALSSLHRPEQIQALLDGLASWQR
ncbi:aminotransferase class I/II-fold pyridoxal phosphate-dependent enzyme [Ampullimonas aquatilis]|uniref:aminotransferase class I/II-fold pyridoxal phosphate-dependent enzyme n=1 Tax=Ampullimonas aquatilis TaxID=1341549 RepID=UPI003C7855D8